MPCGRQSGRNAPLFSPYRRSIAEQADEPRGYPISAHAPRQENRFDALGDASRMARYYGMIVNRRRTSSACRCVSVLSKMCCR